MQNIFSWFYHQNLMRYSKWLNYEMIKFIFREKGNHINDESINKYSYYYSNIWKLIIKILI